MKLSELRPCDNCGNPINPIFYVVRYSMAVIDQQAARGTLGLSQMFGGQLGLAEVLAPSPDAAKVLMDEPNEKGSRTEVFLCPDCYCQDINLAVLAEKITKEEGEE